MDSCDKIGKYNARMDQKKGLNPVRADICHAPMAKPTAQ